MKQHVGERISCLINNDIKDFKKNRRKHLYVKILETNRKWGKNLDRQETAQKIFFWIKNKLIYYFLKI